MNDLVKSLTKDLGLRRPEDALTRVPPTKGSNSKHVLPSTSHSQAVPEPQTVIEPFSVQDGTQLQSSMSKAMRNKERLYFIAMCMTLFLAGWNE
jgi:hypothetical protein